VRFVRSAARWVQRHAFPATAAAVIAIGAAGGGVGYEVASQHSSPAATTGPATSNPSAATGQKGGHALGGGALLRRALGLIASGTGQSVTSVRSQLQAGKSVNDIAGAKASVIQGQILAEITTLADRAVKAGRITAAQEAAGLAQAKTRIGALMAEPGTQFIKDVKQLLQILKHHAPAGSGAPPVAAPSPSP
jgi:hypothetical protein